MERLLRLHILLRRTRRRQPFVFHTRMTSATRLHASDDFKDLHAAHALFAVDCTYDLSLRERVVGPCVAAHFLFAIWIMMARMAAQRGLSCDRGDEFERMRPRSVPGSGDAFLSGRFFWRCSGRSRAQARAESDCVAQWTLTCSVCVYMMCVCDGFRLWPQTRKS